jgi:hypothetical protein
MDIAALCKTEREEQGIMWYAPFDALNWEHLSRIRRKLAGRMKTIEDLRAEIASVNEKIECERRGFDTLGRSLRTGTMLTELQVRGGLASRGALDAPDALPSALDAPDALPSALDAPDALPPSNFAKGLADMATDHAAVIYWDATAHKLVIVDKARFERDVLPRYSARRGTFSTFIRQLQYHGFSQVSNSSRRPRPAGPLVFVNTAVTDLSKLVARKRRKPPVPAPKRPSRAERAPRGTGPAFAATTDALGPFTDAPPPSRVAMEVDTSRQDVLQDTLAEPMPDFQPFLSDQDPISVDRLLQVSKQQEDIDSYLLDDPDLPVDRALLMGIAESLSDTSSADAAKDVDLGEGLELLMEAAEKGDGATQVMLDALLSNIAMLRAERAKRAEEEEKRSIKATADEVSELTL